MEQGDRSGGIPVDDREQGANPGYGTSPSGEELSGDPAEPTPDSVNEDLDEPDDPGIDQRIRAHPIGAY